MKKAIALFGMIIFTAGIVFLKNADADTVLIKQYSSDSFMEQATLNEEEIKTTEQNTVAEAETEPAEEEETTAALEMADDSNFAFFRLSTEEQKIYIEILNSLLNFEQKTVLSTINPKLIDKAFQCVMLDHPEIFYIDGYKYTEYAIKEKVEKVEFTGNYIYSVDEIQSRREQIDLAVSQILAGMPDTDDEYQKVKYIYDSIIYQTEYDIAAEDNQNICSVFLKGRSVCQGYAKAMQYLLNNAGIKAVLVLGKVRQGDGHAWNLVSVNDNWYYIDATWGDAYYLLGDDVQTQMTRTAAINYDYFCVTTEQIEQTHSMDMVIAMPECSAISDNYYVREGLYFTSYEEDRIAELFKTAREENRETITVKCSDSAIYENMVTELIENQKVFQYVDAPDGTIAYTDNEQQNSITFWL